MSVDDGAPSVPPDSGSQPAAAPSIDAVREAARLLVANAEEHGNCRGLLKRGVYRRHQKELARADASVLDGFRTDLRRAGLHREDVRAFMAQLQHLAQGGGLRLMSAADVLDLPPVSFLIDGWLEQHGFAVLYGESGVGKSFVALQWAHCIVTGTKWIDQGVKRGPVVYVAAEGMAGLGKRLRSLMQFYGHDDPPKSLYFIPDAVTLLDQAVVAEAADLCSEMEPALLVIDTYARALTGGDENSARDSGLAVGALDELRRELDMAVLVLHHTGKTGGSERGSGALRGAADSMFVLTKPRGPGLILKCDKQRNVEPPADLALELVSEGDSAVIREFSGTPPAAGGVPQRAKDRIAAEILDHMPAPRDASPIPQTQLLNAVSGRTETKIKVLGELVEAGLIERVGAGKAHYYRRSDSPSP